jgi:hypothetical protein
VADIGGFAVKAQERYMALPCGFGEVRDLHRHG